MVQKLADHLTWHAEDGEALIARVHRSNLPRADAERVEWVIRMYFYVVFALQGANLSAKVYKNFADSIRFSGKIPNY